MQMKKILLLTLIVFTCFPAFIQAAEIWVSPDGNDSNDGTILNPKSSLHSALRSARELRRLNDQSVAGGVQIIMKGGTYYLFETTFLKPEDSGTFESPTIVKSAPGEKPVISGGVKISDWKPLKNSVKGLQKSVKNRIFVADINENYVRQNGFRQVWVNGKKAVRASNLKGENYPRILGVDKMSRSIRIGSESVKSLLKPYQSEFFIHQMWETALLRVKSIDVKGEVADLQFYEPESRLEFDHPWPPPVISDKGNSIFRLENAIEFLDEPGEWFYDSDCRKLYYFPLSNEDMATAEVVVPVLENLVKVTGSKENPVKYIYFDGITFSHSSWMRPSTHGYVPLQAGMFLLDAYKLKVPGTKDKAALENQAWIGRQPATVELENVRNTIFKNCTFEHCGASGLDYREGTSFDIIEGCTFKDIAGSGLVAGRFSDPGVETHLPYNPSDERELTCNMTVRNNYLSDIANEYWGCVGILAGYARDITIEHNELCELSYSGISVGWGWTKSVNCMKNNRIHANLIHHFGKHNYSCGGIYTLSAQPGSSITENCIRDIYKPSYVHDDTGFYIYLDEASSYLTIKDNWCTEIKIGKNQNGMNILENNGPEVSAKIKNVAGLNK
jgi:hypothetical protein